MRSYHITSRANQHWPGQSCEQTTPFWLMGAWAVQVNATLGTWPILATAGMQPELSR